MQTSLECIPCLVRQAEEAIALTVRDSSQQSLVLRRVMRELADLDWLVSPPVVADGLHRIVREMTGNPDPYRAVKDRMNRLAIEALPQCRTLIASAADPREVAVKLAVAGNLFDSGANAQCAEECLRELFTNVCNYALAGNLAEFFQAANTAERILYLTDNAGEIVFDQLLINELPLSKVTVAVRGYPIFFLFTVKCPLVALQIGESPGSLVAKKSACWTLRKPHRLKKLS